MSFIVEPRNGRELQRLVTAMLNMSGLIKRLVDDAVADGANGIAVIDGVADAVASALAPVAEHADDAEIRAATAVVGRSAICLAAALGLEDRLR